MLLFAATQNDAGGTDIGSSGFVQQRRIVAPSGIKKGYNFRPL